MKLNAFYCSLIIMFFAGCKGISDKKIVGKYYLVANDYFIYETTLSYSVNSGDAFVGIIDPMVFAVGFNENYIIAKQHPTQSSEIPNKSITNFFILPISSIDSLYPEKNLLGPYSETEFNKKRMELNLPNSLNFTIFIK